jgi:hypothetical protein
MEGCVCLRRDYLLTKVGYNLFTHKVVLQFTMFKETFSILKTRMEAALGQISFNLTAPACYQLANHTL